MVRVGVGMLAMAAVALVVQAQGPSPLVFGDHGPGPGWMKEGMFEFGGLIGGLGGKTITGKPFEATFTITRTQTLPGNSITSTTTGTVARGGDGSIYREAKFQAIGPWASSGKEHHAAFIRNLAKGTEYVVNMDKGTYTSFAIREPNSQREGEGRPRDSAANGETLTDNPNATYKDPVTNTVYSNVDDRKVTRTIPSGAIGNANPIVITTERWYSNDLNVLLMETHSDPRFGTSTYQLSNLAMNPAGSLFTPDPSFTEVPVEKFHHGGRGEAGRTPPPTPPPPPGE